MKTRPAQERYFASVLLWKTMFIYIFPPKTAKGKTKLLASLIELYSDMYAYSPRLAPRLLFFEESRAVELFTSMIDNAASGSNRIP